MTDNDKPHLLRQLNLLDTTFLVIGAVVGSGIFMTTGFIAESLPSPGLIILIWIIGGFITLCGALAFAELGTMYPKAGGQYVYLRETYGKGAGFLYGWAFFWVIECGGIAALAVAFAEFFGYFVPALSTQSYLLKTSLVGIDYTLSAGQLIAVLAIAVLSAANYFGLKTGITVQNFFTFLRIAAVAVFVILGLAIGKKEGYLISNQLVTDFSMFNIKYVGLGLIAVFWTFDGWYSANCTAEEVKRPERNIPLGLILGTVSITTIYLLINILYLLALPIDKMKGVARIGELASNQLFGETATFFISGLIMISIFGCLSATILYGPRVYYAMAEDKSFFKSMKYIHPKYRVPTKAIFWQAVWASILCISGTFQALYEYVVFALVIFFAATGLAVIILRYKRPDIPRPYRAWGYPILPLFFILINFTVFVNTILAQPFQSLIGLIILIAGIPAFLYWKSKEKRNSEVLSAQSQ
jgi:APA family basic amino acid/polyamine antiporter